MNTKEWIQDIIQNELTMCFADCSHDNINKWVEILERFYKDKTAALNFSDPYKEIERLKKQLSNFETARTKSLELVEYSEELAGQHEEALAKIAELEKELKEANNTLKNLRA